MVPPRLRRLAIFALLGAVLMVWTLFRREEWDHESLGGLESQYPLLYQHVHMQTGEGGAWYIPANWTTPTHKPPRNIVEAAEWALQATNASDHYLPFSTIPMIVHQTWKTTRIDTWPQLLRHSAERWLQAATEGPMAYFLWTDEGMAQLVHRFEPGLAMQFAGLASNVERSDVFRIVVSKWIGGVYGDIDTEPLRPPTQWISATDLLPWTDTQTGTSYPATAPVQAIVGLEADCREDTDTYWRMGYSQPVQLTQWAFAWAPGHPILQTFLDRLTTTLQTIADRYGGSLQSRAARQELLALDPLTLTGPAAFTEAVRSRLAETTGLRWQALSGLEDGGRSKVVDDVLVLPITGFSPGRGAYGNMGSKPVTDASARLRHLAQGSWRAFDWTVEYGKFCRTMLGRCRDWSKVPVPSAAIA
ncbi:glycosyltransferase family 32 protein [Aspergillus saccharolyticus JOP 1030-1]|uniref:Putative alpha-1,6-mannosyltransferase n=1 Tax=Aspergillus saccharolyticus JOP 1030-1 TaxID=1450539 RepID=A0A318ZS48_9EURO|nr:putative alpha-1,6-mannosyltransferase [Aspergillus saccharolyticus JOP 1030-1]PYH42908.1 putative alpha-1,6-mannosyltransferase [Aspergillus saccharolyticus JOP 1030-1]